MKPQLDPFFSKFRKRKILFPVSLLQQKLLFWFFCQARRLISFFPLFFPFCLLCPVFGGAAGKVLRCWRRRILAQSQGTVKGGRLAPPGPVPELLRRNTHCWGRWVCERDRQNGERERKALWESEGRRLETGGERENTRCTAPELLRMLVVLACYWPALLFSVCFMIFHSTGGSGCGFIRCQNGTKEWKTKNVHLHISAAIICCISRDFIPLPIPVFITHS